MAITNVGLAVNKDRQMDYERLFWTSLFFSKLITPWDHERFLPKMPLCGTQTSETPRMPPNLSSRSNLQVEPQSGKQSWSPGMQGRSQSLEFMKHLARHVACWTFCLQVYSKGTSSFDPQQENIFIFHLLPLKIQISMALSLLSNVSQPPLLFKSSVFYPSCLSSTVSHSMIISLKRLWEKELWTWSLGLVLQDVVVFADSCTLWPRAQQETYYTSSTGEYTASSFTSCDCKNMHYEYKCHFYPFRLGESVNWPNVQQGWTILGPSCWRSYCQHCLVSYVYVTGANTQSCWSEFLSLRVGQTVREVCHWSCGEWQKFRR